MRTLRTEPGDRHRGLSKVLGSVLLIAITVLLIATVAFMTTGVVEETQDDSQVHGLVAFDLGFEDDTYVVEPEAKASSDATYVLRINDRDVYEWDGTERVRINCLYPGEDVQLVERKGDSTHLVADRDLEYSTDCRLTNIADKFKYALITHDGSTVQKVIQPEFPFSLRIDPDGDGTDDTYGNPVFRRNVAEIPVTNDWHYVKRYDSGIGPYSSGPVWLIILTDNVHWQASGAAPSKNWTDEPTGEPGKNAFTRSGGTIEPVSTTSTEPTNDIYMLFKPRCQKSGKRSDLAILDVTAGYENQIYLNGKLEVPDTSIYDDSNPNDGIEQRLSVSAVSC